MFSKHIKPIIKCLSLAACLSVTLLFTQTVTATSDAPQIIPEDQSCGKCGMYPARYPQWQTQVVFDDGSMVPFDGAKCMFGFIFNMSKYDAAHSKENITKIWTKDFNSGEWLDAKSAHYVIGSGVMGPMGKELIPFKEAASAQAFQKEHGGNLAGYDSISMDTLTPLMHKKHMKGHKKDNGHHNSGGHQEMQKHHMK